MGTRFIGKEEAITNISNLIRKYGFNVRLDSELMPTIDESTWDRRASFYISTTNGNYEDYSKDENEIMYKFKIKARAAICSMGGDLTTEELLSAAEEIKQKALLADEINKMELEFFTIFSKF